VIAQIEHEGFAGGCPGGSGPFNFGRSGKQATTHLLHLTGLDRGSIKWSFYARELTAQRTNKVSEA
jgi:hypothetical protein